MKFYLMHHLHINPSEIEQMEFYEYQYTINNLVEHLNKEKEGRKEQEEQGAEQYSDITGKVGKTQGNAFKGAGNYMKNLPSGIKTPSLKMPSL